MVRSCLFRNPAFWTCQPLCPLVPGKLTSLYSLSGSPGHLSMQGVLMSPLGSGRISPPTQATNGGSLLACRSDRILQVTRCSSHCSQNLTIYSNTGLLSPFLTSLLALQSLQHRSGTLLAVICEHCYYAQKQKCSTPLVGAWRYASTCMLRSKGHEGGDVPRLGQIL